MRAAVLIGVVCAIFSVGGCASESPTVPADPCTLPAKDRCVAEITFQDYGDEKHVEGVLYCVNGVCLGKGDDGIDAMLAKLRQLPAGSVVLIPYDGNEPKRLPFYQRIDEFMAVIQQRQFIYRKGAFVNIWRVDMAP